LDFGCGENVRADEKLTVFVGTRTGDSTGTTPREPPSGEIKLDKYRRTGKNLLDYVIRRFNLSSARLNKPEGLDLC